MPVNIPGVAAGKTTFLTTSHWDAPKAYAASLYVPGTALIDSREASITIGNIRSDIVKDPANMDLPNPIAYTNTLNPSSPYIIDGTPAKLEIFISIKDVSLFFEAYSSKYIAAPTPIGILNNPVSPINHMEPNKAALKPASSGFLDG